MVKAEAWPSNYIPAGKLMDGEDVDGHFEFEVMPEY